MAVPIVFFSTIFVIAIFFWFVGLSKENLKDVKFCLVAVPLFLIVSLIPYTIFIYALGRNNPAQEASELNHLEEDYIYGP